MSFLPRKVTWKRKDGSGGSGKDGAGAGGGGKDGAGAGGGGDSRQPVEVIVKKTVFVMWDIDNCQIPKRLNLARACSNLQENIVHNICKVVGQVEAGTLLGNSRLHNDNVKIDISVFGHIAGMVNQTTVANMIGFVDQHDSLTLTMHNVYPDVRDSADKLMALKMAEAGNLFQYSPSKALFVIISGDADFLSPISNLKHMNYQIILSCGDNAKANLICAASLVIPWDEMAMGTYLISGVVPCMNPPIGGGGATGSDGYFSTYIYWDIDECWVPKRPLGNIADKIHRYVASTLHFHGPVKILAFGDVKYIDDELIQHFNDTHVYLVECNTGDKPHPSKSIQAHLVDWLSTKKNKMSKNIVFISSSDFRHLVLELLTWENTVAIVTPPKRRHNITYESSVTVTNDWPAMIMVN